MRHDRSARLGALSAVLAVAALGAVPAAAAPTPNIARTSPDVQAVAAAAPGDYWAVGSKGPHLYAGHFDGTTWQGSRVPQPKGNDNTLRAAAALGPDDVWAFGERSHHIGANRPIAEHWDGTQWTLSRLPNPLDANFSKIWAASATAPDDVWIGGTSYYWRVGYTGFFEHFDGRRWSVWSLGSAGVTSVDDSVAPAPDDIWATVTAPDADGPGLEHFDGNQWSWESVPLPSGATSANLNSLSATSADDVWAFGRAYIDGVYAPFAEHYDGEAWNPVLVDDVPPGENTLPVGAAASPTDIWAAEVPDTGRTVFVNSTGGDFSQRRTLADGVTITAMAMAGATDGVAVGSIKDPQTGVSRFFSLRYDGSHWSRIAR